MFPYLCKKIQVNDPEENGCRDGRDGNPGACTLGKTIDERSQKDGYATELIVVGKACGRLYTATVSKKNSVGFLYNITKISGPELVKVFHLSPVSENFNPGLAYENSPPYWSCPWLRSPTHTIESAPRLAV